MSSVDETVLAHRPPKSKDSATTAPCSSKGERPPSKVSSRSSFERDFPDIDDEDGGCEDDGGGGGAKVNKDDGQGVNDETTL